jgi:transposase-like protein
MNEHETSPNYKRHRFPPGIIALAGWLYFRFPLSYRDVEELLAERGVLVTYETVRQWCRSSPRPTRTPCAVGRARRQTDREEGRACAGSFWAQRCAGIVTR